MACELPATGNKMVTGCYSKMVHGSLKYTTSLLKALSKYTKYIPYKPVKKNYKVLLFFVTHISVNVIGPCVCESNNATGLKFPLVHEIGHRVC